jgi:hypothetical protein
MIPDGRVVDSGEIVEIEAQRRLVLTRRHELKPELHAEGYSRLRYEIEKQVESVQLTVTHEIKRPASKLIEAVSGGSPISGASRVAWKRGTSGRNAPLAKGDVRTECGRPRMGLRSLAAHDGRVWV